MRENDPTAADDDAHRYPLFLDLRGRAVLVVGDGRAAERKAARLEAAGAVVRRLDGASWHGSALDGVRFVVAASGDAALDTAIARAAEARNLFVNIADNPSASSAVVPSEVVRAPLRIAISSGGETPALARLVTARIEAFLPLGWRALGALAVRHGARVAERLPGRRARRRFWEARLNGRVGSLALQGRVEEAERALDGALARLDGSRRDAGADVTADGDAREGPADETTDVDAHEGEVWLVGAGPGDPDLLSFRALRLMQQADVVLHDRLVSEPIMALVPPTAERVYVGKRRSEHALPQESINERLVALAKSGKRVLRLKGGDPFIFGRGGEEIDTLAAHGIPFQVVPGITAAAGCASYAGIPLTHRDHARACLFVTGHLKDGSVDLNWESLVQPEQTVVVYMGLLGLPVICRELIGHGLPPDKPAAIVSQGTLAEQRVVAGTLDTLPALVAASDVRAPTLIIVGDVVRLRERLAWFGTARTD